MPIERRVKTDAVIVFDQPRRETNLLLELYEGAVVIHIRGPSLGEMQFDPESALRLADDIKRMAWQAAGKDGAQ